MSDSFNNSDISTFIDSINRRTKKLCQKLDEYKGEALKNTFSKIIEECAYNQTSNKREQLDQQIGGKKLVRKKTKEELRLLEYFLEQDPSWNRKTITTASKVLGLSSYQVYKWGYDRKNRKDTYFRSNLVNDLEFNSPSDNKPHELQKQTEAKVDVDFNKEVSDLLFGNSKSKENSDAKTDIPMTELSFLSTSARSGDATSISSGKTRGKQEKLFSKLFTVSKINRKRKSDHQNVPKATRHHKSIFENDYLELNWNQEKRKSHKLNENEISKKLPETTNDKSCVWPHGDKDIKHIFSNEGGNKAHASPQDEFEYLFIQKEKETDYFNWTNMFNDVELSGLSNHHSESEELSSIPDHIKSNTLYGNQGYLNAKFENTQREETFFF